MDGRKRMAVGAGAVLLLLLVNVYFASERGPVAMAGSAGPEELSGIYRVPGVIGTGNPGPSGTRSGGASSELSPQASGNGEAPPAPGGAPPTDPAVGGGDFASYTPRSLAPGLGERNRGAGVALGDLDHDGVQEMVTMTINRDATDFEYWVCSGLNASGACDGGVSQKRTWGGPSGAVYGAGLALGDIDGNRELDALFMYITPREFTWNFRYWICADLSVAGDCSGGWKYYGKPGAPEQNYYGLEFSFPVTVLDRPQGGGVALGNVGGTPALDAVFLIVNQDHHYASGTDWAESWTITCLDLTVDGSCSTTTTLTNALLPRLDSASEGAGVALAEITGDRYLDLVIGTFAYRTGFTYQVCPNFRADPRFRSSACNVGQASAMKSVPGANVAPAVGGALALTTDLPRRRDLNHNGSLDGVFLLVNDTAGADRFDYWVALDGFIAVKVRDFGAKNLPWVPYLIVHDPNGNESQACFERSTTNTLGTELSFEVAAGVSVEAEALGVSGRLGVTLRAAGTQGFETSYTTSDRLCSSDDSDRDRIGPGYGDRYWGAQWDMRWWLLEVTVDRGGTLSQRRTFAYTVDDLGEWTKYAWEIRTRPEFEPWREFLLGLNVGANNSVPAGAILNRTWDNITESTEVGMSVGATSKASAQFGIEIDSALALELGFVTAEVTVTMALGTTVTATTTQTETNTYHIRDPIPSVAVNPDNLDIDVYWDTAFGTPYFRTRNAWTDPPGESRTTLPCEHWTACGDTEPPQLHSLTFNPRNPISPGTFDVRALLNDFSGLTEVGLVLTRKSDYVPQSLYLPRSSLAVTLADTGETEQPPGGTVFEVFRATVDTGDLQGLYEVTEFRAIDGEGNQFPPLDRSIGAVVVTEDGSAKRIYFKDSPGAIPARTDTRVDLNSEGVPVSLTFNLTQTVANYSLSAVLYDSDPTNTSDDRGAGVFVEIEASASVEDALGTVEICVRYNPKALSVPEADLKVSFYNGTGWEKLDSRIHTIDDATHEICATVGHLSLWAPIGNWPPTADAGADRAVDEGAWIAFSASRSRDRDGSVVAYAWDFGDGTPGMSGPSPTHRFGDDGAYIVTVTVTDNEGASASDSATITVANLAPSASLDPLSPWQEGDSGTIDLRASDPGSDDITLSWSWGDGTPTDGATHHNDLGGMPDPQTSPYGRFPFDVTVPEIHTYGDNGIYRLQITVADDDGGSTVLQADVVVENVAPSANLLVVTDVEEGSSFAATAEVRDPGSDDITLTWSWDDGAADSVETHFNDPTGVPDPAPSPGGTYPVGFVASHPHIYGDDGLYTASLRLEDDDGGVSIAQAVLAVRNGMPIITSVEVSALADLTLRAAGEKWHDIRIEVVEDGVPVQSGSVARTPGSPDDQSLTLPRLRFDLQREYILRVSYTPEDDPENGQPNGATPAWVTLAFSTTEAVTLQRTFNYNMPGAWVWEIDANALFIGRNLTFRAEAVDPGSDYLSLVWDFGDGGLDSTAYFNDGVGPESAYDPLSNSIRTPLGVLPFAVLDVRLHAFASGGAHCVQVTVTDDDGGAVTIVLAVRL